MNQKDSSFTIQPLADADRPWVLQLMRNHWGGEQMVTRGKVYTPSELPGFVAWMEGQRAGLLTYHIEGESCEIMTLESLREGLGVGTQLIEAVKKAATQQECKRLWLITTNDNVDALRFYQKRGFMLIAVHRGAVNESRLIKPTIPETGSYGIPIRDEIELELLIGCQQ